MTEIRSQCEGCGACCRAIFIPFDHDQYEKEKEKRNTADGSDVAFVVNNWYPISNEEALKRNPHLKTWYEGYGENVPSEDVGRHFKNRFYGCRNLDEETGRCKVHETRPRVCSGYPWYERGEPDPAHQFYADDCYYKRDLIQVEEIVEEKMVKA